ncbi:MAG: RNA-binding protein [Betaproteobacteria bacterium]|nr:RNA-binding protein [Betaproteobacteria bacterium]MBV9361610.1 RNA-binding protein [Betaproteobacteria bacterium]
MANPVRIIVGNLPDDISEDTIRQALKEYAPVEKISLVKDSGAPTAIIEVTMGRPQAEALAKRISGRMYHGKPLNAWVPMKSWE